MKILRLLTLIFGLSLALPAQKATAAQPANNNMIGWILGGTVGLGVIWWNIWGKQWAKKHKEQVKEKKKQKCVSCQEEFRTADLITLHPNTKEYLRNNVPNIRMTPRSAYQRHNNSLAKARIDELPKCSTHKMCAECTISHFYNFTTSCAFHYNEGNGHGHCLRCDAKGQCLTCPEIFTEVTVRDSRRQQVEERHKEWSGGTPRSYIRFCNVRLDANWVNRNNPHMRMSLEKQYEYDGVEADRLWNLWEKMCQNYHANRKK